ncbi:hypothetical protein [Leucobacter chinensis]|uniref:hypothetical protein n=1 Tax=Leucobacter chinensis TaxID=2851010 RepID=UPI001C236B5F|nr:hypothetical protein [Leucobacter chinensis]
MDKMIPDVPRSGKKVTRNAAMLFLWAMIAFFTTSRMEAGPLHFVVMVSAFLLLAFSVFEVVQWAWRRKPQRD